jgi:hypothetical protein
VGIRSRFADRRLSVFVIAGALPHTRPPQAFFGAQPQREARCPGARRCRRLSDQQYREGACEADQHDARSYYDDQID